MAHLIDERRLTEYKNEAWFNSLIELNIRHVEQLKSLLSSGRGKIALDKIGVPEELGNLIFSIKKDENFNLGYNVNEIGDISILKKFPMGYKLGDNFIQPPSFGMKLSSNIRLSGKEASLNYPPKDLKSKDYFVDGVNQVPSNYLLFPAADFPQVRDQGLRGTCVAFSLLYLFELEKLLLDKDRPQLSPQFLFYLAKKKEGTLESDGIQFIHGLEILQDIGVCLESDCPYYDFIDWGHSFLFKNKLNDKTLTKKAEQNKIKSFSIIENIDVINEIKKILLQNKPVSLGVPVFRDAWHNEYAVKCGEISMPLVAQDGDDLIFLDEYIGGHAITIVGYQDNIIGKGKSDRPGGGYFIFMNSWGHKWAVSDTDGDADKGYGHIPYEYVVKYFIDGCYINI